MSFYHEYDEDRANEILESMNSNNNNDDWKISFYNYYKPCDFCGETFLTIIIVVVAVHTF